MEKAAKELNGKKFILDRYGKPVVVGKVNVDSLPPFSVPLDLNIKSDDGKKSPYSNRGVSSSDLDIELDAKDKRKPNLRVAGHRSVDSKSFTALTTMSTTLSDIDTIPKVNPGVSIKSATTVRSGSEITEDPSRISRKTYFSRSGSLAGSSSSYAQGKMSKTYGGDSFATEYNSQSYVSNDAPREKRGGRNQNDLLPASMRSIDTLPDIDNPLFDGKPVEETSSVFDPTDEDLGLGPAMTTGMPRVGKLPAKMTAEHKQNIEKLHGKADNGKPRDRDMPKNMRPVKERKHLPAPPLGHIVGHGLSLEKFIEKTTLRAESGDIDWTSQWRG